MAKRPFLLRMNGYISVLFDLFSGIYILILQCETGVVSRINA